MESKQKSIGRNLIRKVNNIINFVMLATFLFLFAYGCYGMWDSHQIYQRADMKQYATYKPSVDNDVSFEELQKMNPEVFGWLTVYGTGIDYPIVQAENNEKYVNTDVKGEHSLAGSIFLDYRNQKNFSDFNNMIFGHHMEKGKMFGDVGRFLEKDFFEKHLWGNLYFDGRDYGIEFLAVLEVNAYDSTVYRPPLSGEESREQYLDHIYQKAKYARQVFVGPEDHLILLSTCASQLTDGRHILVGKITEKVYENTFYNEKEESIAVKFPIAVQTMLKRIRNLSMGVRIFILVFIAIIGSILLLKVWKFRKERKNLGNKDKR